MGCNNSCRLCDRLIISQAVTFAAEERGCVGFLHPEETGCLDEAGGDGGRPTERFRVRGGDVARPRRQAIVRHRELTLT